MKIQPHLIKETPANAVMTSQQASLSMPVSQAGNALAKVGSAITDTSAKIIDGIDRFVSLKGENEKKIALADWEQKKIDITAQNKIDKTLNTEEATNTRVDEAIARYASDETISTYGKKLITAEIENDRIKFVGAVKIEEAEEIADVARNLHDISYDSDVKNGNGESATVHVLEAFEQGVISESERDTKLRDLVETIPNNQLLNIAIDDPESLDEIVAENLIKGYTEEGLKKAYRARDEKLNQMDSAYISDINKKFSEFDSRAEPVTIGEYDELSSKVKDDYRAGKMTDEMFSDVIKRIKQSSADTPITMVTGYYNEVTAQADKAKGTSPIWKLINKTEARGDIPKIEKEMTIAYLKKIIRGDNGSVPKGITSKLGKMNWSALTVTHKGETYNKVEKMNNRLLEGALELEKTGFNQDVTLDRFTRDQANSALMQEVKDLCAYSKTQAEFNAGMEGIYGRLDDEANRIEYINRAISINETSPEQIERGYENKAKHLGISVEELLRSSSEETKYPRVIYKKPTTSVDEQEALRERISTPSARMSL